MWTLKEELMPVFYAWLLLGVSLSAFLVLAKLDLSRLFLTYFFLLLLCFTVTLRTGVRLALNCLRRRGRNKRFLLLVGGEEGGAVSWSACWPTRSWASR